MPNIPALPNNPLTDVLPSKARKYIYALAFLGLCSTPRGRVPRVDWAEAIGAFLTAFVPLMAASNARPPVL